MKKLFAVLLAMVISGVVAVSADEDYFADKPAPVAFPTSGEHTAASEPQVRLSMADARSIRTHDVAAVRAKRQSSRLTMPEEEFIAW